jgi:surface antigen
VGAEIGRSLDERDRDYAYLAADRGLRTNRIEYWKNTKSGHRGRFRPVRSFDRDDVECRDFEHTIWVGNKPELITGTACEAGDGSWRVVN